MLKKYSQVILAITLIGFLFPTQFMAQGEKKSNDVKRSKCKQTECTSSDSCCKEKPAAKESSTSKIWNKVCPVMGEDIDANVATVEYDGKTIGFCCKKCVAKFQKAPAKYLKNLSDDGTKFIKS